MSFFNYIRQVPITTTVSTPPFFVSFINAVYNVRKLFICVKKNKIRSGNLKNVPAEYASDRFKRLVLYEF